MNGKSQPSADGRSSAFCMLLSSSFTEGVLIFQWHHVTWHSLTWQRQGQLPVKSGKNIFDNNIIWLFILIFCSNVMEGFGQINLLYSSFQGYFCLFTLQLYKLRGLASKLGNSTSIRPVRHLIRFGCFFHWWRSHGLPSILVLFSSTRARHGTPHLRISTHLRPPPFVVCLLTILPSLIASQTLNGGEFFLRFLFCSASSMFLKL